MATDFKTRIDNSASLERAARARVQDFDHRNFTEQEIQSRANRYLKSPDKLIEPSFSTGLSINSVSFAEFYRDAKFFIHLNNSQLTNLYKEIKNTTIRNISILSDLNQLTQTLDIFLTEEEIKVNQSYTKVHHNTFTREIDSGLQSSDTRWLTDYKTGLPFFKFNTLNLIQNSGLTLPIQNFVDIPIKNVSLIGEETDVGDTSLPIFSSDPNNLLIHDKIFRHVILRKKHDRTTKLFNHTDSFVTLRLELQTLQLINFIRIEPVSHSHLYIDSLSYINEAGEEITILATRLDTSSIVNLLLEPVRCKSIRIKLVQFAPVTSTNYEKTDKTTRSVNEVLEGLGWSTLLEEKSEVLEGKVYDFSLKSIKLGLNVFEPSGVYRSQDVSVDNPIGLVLTHKSSVSNLSLNQASVGSLVTLPANTTLTEYYVGTSITDTDDNLRVEELIPVPDSRLEQIEVLPLIGGKSRAKLFPDTVWNLNSFRVLKTELGAANELVVTTTSSHNLIVGDTTAFLVNKSSVLNNEFEVIGVASLTSLTLRVIGADSTYLVNENTTPIIYIFKANTLAQLNQSVPFSVYENGVLLTLGDDYEASFDNGETWYSQMPSTSALYETTLSARAGNFRIHILKPFYDRVYTVQYRYLRSQQLDSRGLVHLHNRRVVFDDALTDAASGRLNTVIVMRSHSSSQYSTPIIESYTLKVRENVT